MSAEENIKQALEEKFACLKDKITVKRERRINACVPLENFRGVLQFAVSGLSFAAISAITGSDRLKDFEVIYHLNKDGGIMLNLRVTLDHDKPAVPTVTDIFASAEAYERELEDLLGIEVRGLAPGRRYPLPDDWPAGQHPLRKNWKGSVPAETEDD